MLIDILRTILIWPTAFIVVGVIIGLAIISTIRMGMRIGNQNEINRQIDAKMVTYQRMKDKENG